MRSSMEGTAIAKFSLSVARPGTEGNDYIDIVSFSSQADASQQLKQGDMVLVEGRIQIRSFQNKSGEKNWATEVVASNLKPFKIKAKTAVVNEEVEELGGDDLPF